MATNLHNTQHSRTGNDIDTMQGNQTMQRIRIKTTNRKTQVHRYLAFEEHGRVRLLLPIQLPLALQSEALGQHARRRPVAARRRITALQSRERNKLKTERTHNKQKQIIQYKYPQDSLGGVRSYRLHKAQVDHEGLAEAGSCEPIKPMRVCVCG